MKLRLKWITKENEVIELTRDRVLTHFKLREVKRLDDSDNSIYMEAFKLAGDANIVYNGRDVNDGHKGDYVIVTESDMYIMKGDLFDQEFKLIDSRKFKPDFSKIAESLR